MPGHDCVGARVHINLELTDSGSRRVCRPRGVLWMAHEVVMVAWWNYWWAERVPRRVGGGGESLRRERQDRGRGLLNSERLLRCSARLR